MGKQQVHVLRVRKWVTLTLLVLVTAAMAGLLYFLSGKAYAAETHPVREILARLLGSGRGPVSRDALLAFLMPVIANILLFVPWGFLAFLLFDGTTPTRRGAYLRTVAGALAVAFGMALWQLGLPARVTSWSDTVSHAAGALAGAALGHARKGLYVRFQG